MEETTVLLVEDHTLVRQGLRRILESEPTLRIVGESGNGHEAVQMAGKLLPDIAIVDISLPSLNGIEATRQIRRSSPRTSVLILSMHTDDAYVRRSLRAGARGYLVKDADDHDLVRAVTALRDGGSYFSPRVSRLLLDGYLNEDSGPAEDPLLALSEREREVLQLVAEGKSNKEVAQQLHLSVSTVESHRKNFMEKLDLHNTADVVRFALRAGLVQ